MAIAGAIGSALSVVTLESPATVCIFGASFGCGSNTLAVGTEVLVPTVSIVSTAC